eukprot:NODE_1005_length_2315_cov_0.087094.p1 type:complete len:202 gc:universal NODE_1005_length_2315_cov_0.087094:877-272(-)
MTILKKMAKTVNKLKSYTWEENWRTRNLTWDAGCSSPALIEILDRLPAGKYLIPGCGYGYDVETLSKIGNHAVGLDSSPTCIQLCNQKYKSKLSLNFEFICDDFFKHVGSYDCVYDYTFFCALPIELRSLWGSKMAELIKPRGTLVTLIFPIDNHQGGPPFSVVPQDYVNVLSQFQLKSLSDCTSHKPRQGREKMGIWIRN